MPEDLTFSLTDKEEEPKKRERKVSDLPKYNRRVRKFEKYFSVSYHEAYLELVEYKRFIKQTFNELIKELDYEDLKNGKVLKKCIEVQKAIDAFDSITSRVEYYDFNSSPIFTELFGYIDGDSLYKKYSNYFRKDRKKAYEIIKRVISTEYDRLLVENENFRALVIAILFSIKGPAFYYPKINFLLTTNNLKTNKNYNEYLDYFNELEELRGDIDNE